MSLARSVASWTIVAVALASAPRDARADADEGADEDAAAAPRAPELWEHGPSALPALRPSARRMPVRACSTRAPLCVHGPVGAEGEVLTALHAFESAYDTATGALRLPAPDADPSTGALDVYLTEGPLDDARVRLASRDLLASYDRASAFVELPRALTGCAREAAVQRAVLRAALLRVAPAASEAVSLATTTHLAGLALPCAQGVVDDIAVFQREPQRALVGGGDPDSEHDRRYARGASSFFDWADARFGSEPGGLVRASWALMPSATPPGRERFDPFPDLFTVLRTSFKDVISVNTSLDDVLFRFAGARATFGGGADATTLLGARRWGDAAKIATDVAIDWPTQPRRFLSPKPVAPTGASYLLVRRRGASPSARLRVEAEWEEHARFRWMAIKLDANGTAIGSVLVPSTPRATSAQTTITELEATDAVLLVATNAGDFARPFDPDDGTWEPHAYLVTLASE